MLFSSLIFLFLFLPIVLAGYFVLLKGLRKAQNVFLLIASLVFYAWGEPVFVFVMMGSILVNWFLALRVDTCNKHKGREAKTWLVAAILFNITVIFIAKYLMFTSVVLNQVTGLQLNVPEIALPIGISFYTFQSISYVIDVYRGEPAQKNILNAGLYIALFPPLIAGPIIRYATFAPQIYGRKESWDSFSKGIQRFIIGLGKKVILANTMGLLADRAFTNIDDASVLLLWLGIIAYTLQIYYDFSGYSDMAIGLAKMFGFNFPENFNYPYISKSVSEFWRRWHISLGSWFRDYVYIPLGGSRVKTKARLVFNLFVVWSLTGIWHGANWTFLIWGLLYFALLTIEKIIPKWSEALSQSKVFSRIYTIFFVMMGWVVFRADSVGQAFSYYAGLFGLKGNALVDMSTLVLLQENLFILLIGIILVAPLSKKIGRALDNKPYSGWFGTLLLGILFVLSVSAIVKGFYNPFIYFNF